MRRFAAPHLGAPGDRVELTAGIAHHLTQVCRARPGDVVMLFDGAGAQAPARVVQVETGATLELLEAPRPAAPAHALWAVLAVVKGNAMEHGLRMAVEAGVTHILPCTSQRSVPKGDKAERWERVLQGAAAQCGRADVPELHPLRPLAEQIEHVPSDLHRVVAAPGGGSLAPCLPAAFAIGPEGGWTDAELARFEAAGWQAVGLGDWILRADTAVAVAASALSRTL